MTISKIVYVKDHYVVKEGRRGYTIYNTRKDFDEGHGHIGSQDTCEMLIKLMGRNIVPDSPYLRQTVLRISTDDKYIDKVKRKIEKDRDKQRYYRPAR